MDEQDQSRPARKSEKLPDGPSSEEGEDQAYDVPAESIEILEGIGVDVSNPSEVARFASLVSVSGCPYPSPSMLFAYDHMKPKFSDKIIAVVDNQRERRLKQEEQKEERHGRRLDRAQDNARNLSFFGLILAAGAALVHAPTSLCITIVIVAVGGPNAATVLSRVVDKFKL